MINNTPFGNDELLKMANTAAQDQDETAIKDMARGVALMYRELRAGGMPKDGATSIAAMFAAQVVFPGCACDG